MAFITARQQLNSAWMVYSPRVCGRWGREPLREEPSESSSVWLLRKHEWKFYYCCSDGGIHMHKTRAHIPPPNRRQLHGATSQHSPHKKKPKNISLSKCEAVNTTFLWRSIWSKTKKKQKKNTNKHQSCHVALRDGRNDVAAKSSFIKNIHKCRLVLEGEWWKIAVIILKKMHIHVFLSKKEVCGVDKWLGVLSVKAEGWYRYWYW